MPTCRGKGKVIEKKKGWVDSREIWPPEWKSLEQCALIESGMIYIETYQMDFEQLDRPLHVKTFLKQLLDSRGYELHSGTPRGLCCPFHLLEPPFWKGDQYLMAKLEFATEKINAQAKKHHEKYELVELVRIVEALTFCCDLLTFNVRQVKPKKDRNVVKSVQAMVGYKGGDFQLIEWRFRPGPPESPPEASSFLHDYVGGTLESSGDDSDY